MRVGIPRDAGDDDDDSDKHRRRARRTKRAAIIAGSVIGALLLLGCAVAGCWYVNRSLSEKDRLQAERRVTVQQQVTAARERVGDCVEIKFQAPHASVTIPTQVGEFQSTFNVISGDAFLALGGLGRDAYYEQQSKSRPRGPRGSCPPCRSGRRPQRPRRPSARPRRRGSPTAAEPSPAPSLLWTKHPITYGAYSRRAARPL